MSDHLTAVVSDDGFVGAVCSRHSQVGSFFVAGRTGWNAAGVEARAHDDMAHGVYRSEAVYEAALPTAGEVEP